MKLSNGFVLEFLIIVNVDYVVIIVFKIKEILKINLCKDNKEGLRFRILVLKLFSVSGKFRLFFNLFNFSFVESLYQKESLLNYKYMNGNINGEYYDDEMEEILGIIV